MFDVEHMGRPIAEVLRSARLDLEGQVLKHRPGAAARARLLRICGLLLQAEGEALEPVTIDPENVVSLLSTRVG